DSTFICVARPRKRWKWRPSPRPSCGTWTRRKTTSDCGGDGTTLASLYRRRRAVVLLEGRLVVLAADEPQEPAGHLDPVAGGETHGRLEAVAVDERAVPGGHVVQFGAARGVDDDHAVPARDYVFLEDDVITRQSADGVDADLERIAAVGLTVEEEE